MLHHARGWPGQDCPPPPRDPEEAAGAPRPPSPPPGACPREGAGRRPMPVSSPLSARTVPASKIASLLVEPGKVHTDPGQEACPRCWDQEARGAKGIEETPRL